MPQPQNGKLVFVLLLGWAASRLISLLPLESHAAGLVINPGIFAAIALACILSSPRYYYSGNLVGWAYFLVGTLADSLAFMVFRPGAGTTLVLSSPWEFASLTLSLSVLVLFYIMHSLGRSVSAIEPNAPPSARLSLIFSLSIPAALITIFRLIHFYYKDIPNEERSLFIGGTEIHHAVMGMMLLFLLVSQYNLFRRRPMFGAFLASIAAGLIIDEAGYLQLTHVTDEAYDGNISLLGAVIGYILHAAAGICLARHGKTGQSETIVL